MSRPEKCSACRKPPKDGCSRVNCPSRKQVTAAPNEDAVRSVVYHGYLPQRPRLSDEELE